MKAVIEKLESLLNQGLYGREEEVRLALLCALSGTSLLLYGHDDSEEIQNRFEALFENATIHAHLSADIEDVEQKYATYCFLANHSGGENLAGYLFTPKNPHIFEQLRACAPDVKKVQTFLQNYDFLQLWNTGNQNVTMNFIETLLDNLRLAALYADDNANMRKISIPDRQLKDFLHLIAINLIISGRKEVTVADFGMFFYCVRDWGASLKYLETIIHANMSNQELATFVFHDLEYEKQCYDNFIQQHRTTMNLIPNLEYMFYVPYSSSATTSKNDMLIKLENFYVQFQNISSNFSQADLKEEMKEIRAKENILKTAQLEEMELKEAQLSQLQPKHAAFKTIKDSIEEKLKIAHAKETEFREKQEALEIKLKDAKIREQQEGLKVQIADLAEKKEQFREIKVNLETQIQDAKRTLEVALNQAKKTLEVKQQEVKQKAQDLKALRDRLKLKIENSKGNAEAKTKEAREYLAQLRLVSGNLNRVIEACQKEINLASKPNPIWLNPLKMHKVGLEKIQKNLPNMIRVFDAQIKKYEESAKDNLQF